MTSIADRLFNQIKLQQEREEALQAAQDTLKRAVEIRDSERAHRSKAEDDVVRFTSMLKTLEKQMQAQQAEAQAITAKNDEEKKVLMKALEAKVEAVNTRVEEVTTRKAKAVRENARLKEQLNILETHKASGTDKFTELVEAREKEVGSFETQLEKETLISELLQKQNEMTKMQIDKLTVIHDTLKGKVEVYAAKFHGFQDQLKAARAIFDESQKAREAMVRRINVLKGEREQSKLRAIRARKEYEAEETKVAIAEKQALGLEIQIKTLLEATQAMLNPSPAAAVEAKKGDDTPAAE